MSDWTIEEFRRQGFLHLKGFFDPAEVEQIRCEAKEVFIRQMLSRGIVSRPPAEEAGFEQALYRYFESDLTGFMNCGKHIQHLISLHRLAVDPRIEATLRELQLQSPNICTRPVLFFNSRHLAKKEIYWRVFTHQDWRSMQGSLDSVVVWIPLVDVDRRLGALEIVPGSHRRGLLTSSVEDGFGKVEGFSDDQFAAVEAQPGDAIFFSAFLVHRSGNNQTRSIRWSCHFRYNNLEEPTFIARGYPHPYIYKPAEELLTPGFPTVEEVQQVFEGAASGSIICEGAPGEIQH